jgi:hypothetical protein
VGVAVPESLCRFVRSEWPGEAPFRQWTRARMEFIREHGHETVLGDPFDVLTEHRRLIMLGVADGD